MAGADCWPGCLAEHGHLHTGSGLGHGTGFAAGGGGRGGVRPVSHTQGACAAAAVGQCAGPCVLGVRDRHVVLLVAGRVGRMDSAVWSGGTAGRGDGLLLAVQPRIAEIGLSRRRFGHLGMSFGSYAHERGNFPAEKNEKFCKKPLSLWTQMV